MRRWSRTHCDAGNGSGRCHLLELPAELLLEIVSYLAVEQEACLALTCRSMFVISGAILESQALRFGRDFAPLFHHYRNGHNLLTARWKLITKLEDNKWTACSGCLKLHPRTAFSSRELKQSADERTCLLGDLAGIVDLCPCRKLTFRDKMDLVDLLKARQESVDVLYAQFGSIRERFCWHSCTQNYGSTVLNIQIYPELDEAGKLRIRTEYRLSIGEGQLGKEESMTPRFGCAHRSVDLWLASCCQTALCRLPSDTCASCKRISVCNACSSVLRCSRKRHAPPNESNQVTYSFWTQRCLGGSSPQPDNEWATQRVHPAETLFNIDNCTEMCPWTVREHPPPDRPPSLGNEIIDSAVNNQSVNQLYSSVRLI